jgi:hypothetical protein
MNELMPEGGNTIYQQWKAGFARPPLRWIRTVQRILAGHQAGVAQSPRWLLVNGPQAER